MSNHDLKNIFKILSGMLIIAFVLTASIRYIKVLPILLKVVVVAVNAITIYLSYTYLIKRKKDRENGK
jgi:uncharacterized protein YacL